MLADRIDCILTTSRIVTTGRRKQGRYEALVEVNEANHNRLHDAHFKNSKMCAHVLGKNTAKGLPPPIA